MILHVRSAERVVLALWVALPLVGHEDPPQAGMALEGDPEEVEDLAFVEVRGRPHARHRRAPLVALGDPHPHAQTMRVGRRRQVICDQEPALGRIHAEVVDRGQVREQLERRIVTEDLAEVRDAVARDLNGHFAERLGRLGHGHGKPFTSVRDDRRQAIVHAQLLFAKWLARICSCSFKMPSISISGRGGHPGTYISTGTIWSTPCTMA